MSATVAAGVSIPPQPRPAKVPKTVVVIGFVGFETAKAPKNAAVETVRLIQMGIALCLLMIPDETQRTILTCPLTTASRASPRGTPTPTPNEKPKDQSPSWIAFGW